MTTQTEALKMAIEAMKTVTVFHNPDFLIKAINTCKEALQSQEPQYLYAWACKEDDSVYLFYDKPSGVLEDEVHKYIGKIKLEVDDAV